MKFTPKFASSILLLFSVATLGCASYQGKVESARTQLQAGNYDAAVADFEKLAADSEKDKLVYLLDLGTALHIAGRYEESNKVFSQADDLAEQLDYHSVSKIAGSLVLNEEMVQYKGDTFERIFINAYKALNYLELGDYENAEVQARRINEKFQKYRADDKKKFELNFFARYIGALAREAAKDYDNAYIAMKDAYEVDSRPPQIKKDLIRLAKLSGREKEHQKWLKEFGAELEDPRWYDRSLATVVFVFHQGWGPQKDNDPINYRFPLLKSGKSSAYSAEIEIAAEDNPKFKMKPERTTEIYNVAEAAIKTLQDDRLSLIGRRAAGLVAKKAVSDKLRERDDALGLVASLVMHASDRADLRQWSTLPNGLQIARVQLQPGHYQAKVRSLNSGEVPQSDWKILKDFTIKKGQQIFVNWRAF